MSYAHPPLARPVLPPTRIPWLAFVFLAVAFFYVYHDFLYARNGFNPSEDDLAGAVMDGSPTRRMALLSLGIFAMVSLILQRAGGRMRIQGLLGWALLGFVALVMVSPVWAEDRSQTITRVVGFGILCLLAVAIARRFSLREIILWAFFASGWYVVIGVLAEILFGNFRPLASGYRFAGTLHPNSQGVNCALLVLSAMAAADQIKPRRRIFCICALFGLVFLVLTGSRTALAAASLALIAYFGASWSRRAKMAAVYALSIIFCLLLLLSVTGLLPNLKAGIMLGRDSSSVDSFNGRTGIWEEIAPYVRRSPVLGYGYGGFWTPRHIAEISGKEQWGIPNSHSAYLDYLLTLGTVGLVAYIFLLFAGLGLAFRFQRISHDSAFALCGAVLVFSAVDGILESAVSDLSLMMFLIWVVLACLALKDYRNPNLSWHFRPANKGARA